MFTNRMLEGRRRTRALLQIGMPVAAALVAITATAGSATAIGLVSGLGGVRDYGEEVLAANDDGSTTAVDITPVFGASGINFFGTNYTALHVNNNGNFTFSGPLATYTPFGISGASIPIIAGFFGDVDTRGAHVPADANLVYYDLDSVNGVFTATWDLVGYFGSHTDKLNNFQIRLIDQGFGNFDIEFRYESLQWTTGDASGGSGGLGGSPARAGFSAGDGVNFAELAASGNEAAMLDLVNQSNVGDPGRFVFEVFNGVPQICGNGLIQGFEECDDDNNDNGDGCSADCVVEACYTCSGEPSVCTPAADGTSCSDGQYCNGAESCLAGSCQPGTAPCGLGCDEGGDSCVSECPAAPLSCRAAGKTVLVAKDSGNDDKDKFVWKWLKGEATTQSQFGDPTDATDYVLCLYAGAASDLVGQSVVPGTSTAWKPISSRGYKFKNKSGNDGVQKIVLKGSSTDKVKVLVKGKGAGLPDLARPIQDSLSVQLINSRNGLCWGASYTEAQLDKNDAVLLKGKTP